MPVSGVEHQYLVTGVGPASQVGGYNSQGVHLAGGAILAAAWP
jgi:hypothetical protein